MLLLTVALTGAVAGAQEKTETRQGDVPRNVPPIEFKADPQQKRLDPTTQIVTNSSRGTAARAQAGGESSVDEDIRKRVMVSLSTGSTGTQGILASEQLTDIKVSVTNRVVTLDGPVVSEGNKKTLGKRVAGLDGVKSVNNQLKVDPGSKPARSSLVQPDGYSQGKTNGVQQNPGGPK